MMNEIIIFGQTIAILLLVVWINRIENKLIRHLEKSQKQEKKQ